MITDLERFENKIFYSPCGCWYWTGTTNIVGYGRFSFEGKNHLAHRVSYLLHKGQLNNLFVLHSCDNRLCVNPAHLCLGTQQNNVDDMFSKNRGRKMSGERHHLAKFSNQQVIEMRSLKNKMSHNKIAKKYGASEGYGYCLLNNKIRKNG